MNNIQFFQIKILPAKRKKTMPFTQTSHFLQLKLTLKFKNLSTIVFDRQKYTNSAQYFHLSDKPILRWLDYEHPYRVPLKNNNLRKMLFLTT